MKLRTGPHSQVGDRGECRVLLSRGHEKGPPSALAPALRIWLPAQFKIGTVDAPHLAVAENLQIPPSFEETNVATYSAHLCVIRRGAW